MMRSIPYRRHRLLLACLVVLVWGRLCDADAASHSFTPQQMLAELAGPESGPAPSDRWWLTPPRGSTNEGIELRDGAVRLQGWAVGSRLQSPHGLIPPPALEPGGRVTIDMKLRVDAGRLYLRIHNGVRFYQVLFTDQQIAFSRINPNEGETFSHDLSGRPHTVRLAFDGRVVTIAADGVELGRFDAGLGGGTAFSGLAWSAHDRQRPPDAWIYAVAVRTPTPPSPAASAEAEPAAASPLPFHGAWPEQTFELDSATVTVGPIRVLMRQARTPMIAAHDELILLTGNRTVASTDRGVTWRPRSTSISHLNSVFLHDGQLVMLRYDPKPVPDQPGVYQTERWISDDRGETVVATEPATLHLPPDRFDPARTQWLHSGLIQTPGGDLLSVMQGEELVDAPDAVLPWRLFLVRSRDQGLTWRFVSIIADHERLEPIQDALTQNGWRSYGGVEPTLLALDDDTLICVSRTVDDESYLEETLFSEPSETYHDLSYTVRGDEIHPGIARLPADRYFTPGPPSAPTIIMRSEDGGATWSAPQPMQHARGCFPRLASNGGVVALTFGGLAVPRWGNGVCFSFDRGVTWTEPVIFAPFLTTGYTGIVPTGPNRFTAFFDCTPPQPWKDPSAFWIGAADITVHVKAPADSDADDPRSPGRGRGEGDLRDVAAGAE